MLPVGPVLRVTGAALVLTSALLAAPHLRAVEQTYQREVEGWREQHEKNYRKEYVPLAGLFPLKVGANTIGSAPGSDIQLPKRAAANVGRILLEDDGKDKIVRFDPAKGIHATVRGFKVTDVAKLRNDEDADGADEVLFDDMALWVHISGDRPTIRLRDPKGDAARSFKGFKWFAIDENYRVTGRFIPDPAARELRIANQLGDEDTMKTEGVVEFTLNGQTVRLRPMTTRPKRLWFIFRDGTSGKETYETARFLYADLADDGTTVLDFNEAYNPPCAFNPYTTCPLPLPENRLQIRILAGERAYNK